MFKKISYFIYPTAFILLFLSSCKKQDELTFQQGKLTSKKSIETMVYDVKSWYDSAIKSNSTVNSQNVKISMASNLNDINPPIINWNKAYINFDSNNIKSLTIPIEMDYKNGEHMELVATKSNNKLNGYLIKTKPDSTYFANQIDIYDYTNFSGSISIYNLMGIRLKKEIFKAGIVSNSINTKTPLSNNTTFDSSPPPEGFTLYTVIVSGNRTSYYYTGFDNTLSYVYITYNQNFQLDDFGGGGGVIVGGYQDFDEEEIYEIDDGTEQKSDGRNTTIPQDITLSNGNIVKVNFQPTKDGTSSNQQVNVRTLECLKKALEIVSFNGQTIKSILITATTNGHPYFDSKGNPLKSDHHSGAAIDIGAINGVRINGASDLTLSFQSALNQYSNIRENFGPGLGNSYKFGDPIHDIPNHNTHIHFSIIIPQ